VEIDATTLGVVALLGAYHGLNPAMGWLFAVSLGLQNRSRRAVLRAVGPIALGHEAAVGVVALLVLGLGIVADAQPLRVGAGAVLIAFGIFRFARPRAHPRWTRGQVTPRELSLWSFLMSGAHGAGLMVAPVLLRGDGTSPARAHDGEEHGVGALTAGTAGVGETALALAVHVGVLAVVMGGVAVLVYDRLGVGVLRRAWLNTEWLWAGAFVVAGVFTLFGPSV
jgi:hypothetical protein